MVSTSLLQARCVCLANSYFQEPIADHEPVPHDLPSDSTQFFSQPYFTNNAFDIDQSSLDFYDANDAHGYGNMDANAFDPSSMSSAYPNPTYTIGSFQSDMVIPTGIAAPPMTQAMPEDEFLGIDQSAVTNDSTSTP